MLGRQHGAAPERNNTAAVIPAELIAHASLVHADCSRLAENLHAAEFPQDRGALAAGIKRDLRSAVPRPGPFVDRFSLHRRRALRRALANTIHLLYHTDRPTSKAAVSLFVQPNSGQFALEAWRVYSVSVAQSPFPMLAWRSQDVVYFLLADDEKTEQAALKLIRAPHDIEQQP